VTIRYIGDGGKVTSFVTTAQKVSELKLQEAAALPAELLPED